MTTFPLSQNLSNLLSYIHRGGGNAIIVGGAVRDFLLDGREPKDVDVEVYGLGFERLESELSGCPGVKVDAVGKNFGVLKVTMNGSQEIPSETFDVSLPRRENKEGQGHRGFMTTPDPNMSFEEAALRRDFTVNTIGFDPKTGEFLDPFNGLRDIEDRVLRATSEHFSEDPLRVLRACQFAARFGFSIDERTVEMCWDLNQELATLPKERLWEEWKKLLLKSERPSIGIKALKATGALVLFPEVAALLNVAQDPEWHPEGQNDPDGSLWVHNNMVTDEAAKIIRRDNLSEEESLIVMLGAFCHDFGKPATTKFETGRWRSKHHEEEGEFPTRSFLARIGCPPGIVDAVVAIVVDHLKPSMFFRDKSSPAAIRRLALKVPLERLVRVAEADHFGRDTPDALNRVPWGAGPWLLQKASELKVREKGPEPLLLGRHLMELGVQPGKEMGNMLRSAFEAQIEGDFEDLEGAQAWARQKFATT